MVHCISEIVNMAGPGVFHVEFGINETKLTQLLERRRYAEAEKLIEVNTNASYLDEGKLGLIFYLKCTISGQVLLDLAIGMI